MTYPKMSDLIRIVESAGEVSVADLEPHNIPKTVYHGSCIARWQTDRSSPDGLYVTINRGVAANYAREWQEDGEEPIIVEIDLAAFPESSFGPNAETVEQYEEGKWGGVDKDPDDLTWLDTLRLNGTFVIFGFNNQHKPSVTVVGLN